MPEKHFRLFHRKAKPVAMTYDKDKQKPMIKCSICNGEQIAGFRDKKTGTFSEVMLITDEDDLNNFCKKYGIVPPIEKFY